MIVAGTLDRLGFECLSPSLRPGPINVCLDVPWLPSACDFLLFSNVSPCLELSLMYFVFLFKLSFSQVKF